jgi:hypothetical protein
MDETTTPTSEDLKKEVESHFNEVMLSHSRLGRCIGYAEDDTDCYIIVLFERRKIVWHTMVGGYTWLKCLEQQNVIKIKDTDKIWNDYSRLDSLLSLNEAPKQDKFLVVLEEKENV